MDFILQEMTQGDGILMFIAAMAVILKYALTILFLIYGILAFIKYINKG